MYHQTLNLDEKLARSDQLEREEEVRVILESVRARLDNPKNYEVIDKTKIRGIWKNITAPFTAENWRGVSFRLINSDNKEVVKMYTGDPEGFSGRFIEALDYNDVVTALEAVSNISPRKLHISYFHEAAA